MAEIELNEFAQFRIKKFIYGLRKSGFTWFNIAEGLNTRALKAPPWLSVSCINPNTIRVFDLSNNKHIDIINFKKD